MLLIRSERESAAHEGRAIYVYPRFHHVGGRINGDHACRDRAGRDDCVSAGEDVRLQAAARKGAAFDARAGRGDAHCAAIVPLKASVLMTVRVEGRGINLRVTAAAVLRAYRDRVKQQSAQQQHRAEQTARISGG